MMESLTRWLRSAPRPDPHRWLMVDVETTGLDPQHDSLLAIAAIAIEVDWPRRQLALRPGDSFDVVLRHEGVVDRANILVHGIGVGRQREGTEPAAALAAFERFAANSPLLGFHVAFDRAMIERACRLHLGAAQARHWVDLEQLCAATHDQVKARALDDWIAHFGIQCLARHMAAADALVQSELLMRIWPKVAAQCDDWKSVARLAANARWLRRA